MAWGTGQGSNFINITLEDWKKYTSHEHRSMFYFCRRYYITTRIIFSIEMLSISQSLCPHVSPCLPKDSFLWRLILGLLWTPVEITEILLISGKNIRHFIWRPRYTALWAATLIHHKPSVSLKRYQAVTRAGMVLILRKVPRVTSCVHCILCLVCWTVSGVWRKLIFWPPGDKIRLESAISWRKEVDKNTT
jgi:hypothetical protein